MNALVKMAKAVIDESEVSPADMKLRNKAFDVIKDLVCAKINNTKAKPEAKQSNKAHNKNNKSTSLNSGNARSSGCSPFVVISGSLIFAIIVLLISLWLRRDTLNPPNNNQLPVQAEQSSDSSSNSSSNSPESASSSDYIDPIPPALSPEQDDSANPQDIQTVSNDVQVSQDSERIAAEIELAKAKKDLLLAERALMEERRLAATSNSNYVPQDKTTSKNYIPCEYMASSPLVCESRKDQPAMCSWNYSSCGSPRLQKKLSKSSCNNRVTLDVQNNQIIVTAGCRAQFVPEIE
jgi:cytoskeletal protein RodZ